MPNLLLIDSTVGGYQQIVGAVNSDTTAVVFDSNEDTYDTLRSKIIGSGFTNFSTVGIVQHGSDTMLDYRLLKQSAWATVANVEKEDPSLITWSEFRGFLEWLKNGFSTQIVDLISCKLYSNNDFVYVMNTLEAQTGLNLRASSDNTGNLANGGNWVQESDNVNIEGIYFTSAIQSYNGLLYGLYLSTNTKRPSEMITTTNKVVGMVGNSTTTFKRIYNCVGKTSSIYITGFDLPSQYSILSWGLGAYGGATPSPVPTNIVAVQAVPSTSFAAIKSDGTAQAWGYLYSGATPSPAPSNVVALATTDDAYAALLNDGTVTCWGFLSRGGTTPSPVPTNVVGITGTDQAFCALKSNGTVQCWGQAASGGTTPTDLLDAVAISQTQVSFCALRSNGRVQAWGDAYRGGTYPTNLTDAVAIQSNFWAFCAIRSNGGLYAWGPIEYGGYVGTTKTGYIAIAATEQAFCALNTDGTIIAWGQAAYGGTTPSGLTNVIAIAANGGAFCALKSDGTVQAWGNSSLGGTTPSPAPSNVIAICANANAFTVLKADGTVQSWGDTRYGGVTPTISNVVSIVGNYFAFAAIKSDKTVQCWGFTDRGGNTPSPIPANVETVVSNAYAFTAMYTFARYYSYTVISESQKTAIFNGYSGNSPTGSLQLMYISGSTSDATLSSLPNSSSYTIVGIGANALQNSTALTTVTAPFITSVGASAFSGCTTLQYVYFGLASGVTSFGTSCFDGCSALSYICKNAYNTDAWPASVITNVRTVLIKNYFPLIVMPSVSLTSATSFTITLIVSGGNVQDNVFTFTNTFTNTKNGTQVYNGGVNTPMTVATTDTYSMTVGNTFETSSSNASGGSTGVSNYQYGARVKRLLIGN